MLKQLYYLPLVNFIILLFIVVVVVIAYGHILSVLSRVETALKRAEQALKVSQEAKKTAIHAEQVSESMINAANEWRDL